MLCRAEAAALELGQQGFAVLVDLGVQLRGVTSCAFIPWYLSLDLLDRFCLLLHVGGGVHDGAEVGCVEALAEDVDGRLRFEQHTPYGQLLHAPLPNSHDRVHFASR